MSNPLTIKTTAGDVVKVDHSEFTRVMTENISTLIGLSLPAIAALRMEFLQRSDLEPTPQNIKTAFSP